MGSRQSLSQGSQVIAILCYLSCVYSHRRLAVRCDPVGSEWQQIKRPAGSTRPLQHRPSLLQMHGFEALQGSLGSSGEAESFCKRSVADDFGPYTMQEKLSLNEVVLGSLVNAAGRNVDWQRADRLWQLLNRLLQPFVHARLISTALEQHREGRIRDDVFACGWKHNHSCKIVARSQAALHRASAGKV